MSNADPAIIRVHAREVLDSRGRPTVEVEVACRDGSFGRAIVPSGASTGRHEAVELRDGDPARYGGKGVRKAVANVRDLLTPRLLGMDATDQARIDRVLCEIDGTPNKARPAPTPCSACRWPPPAPPRRRRGLPLWRYLDTEGRACLPLPMVNLISGGLHAGGNLDFQDFLLLPVGARTYSEALEMTVAVYRALGAVLTRHGFEGVLVGDEGGFGPRLHSNEQAVEMILEAIRDAGLTPGKDAALALDVASTPLPPRWSLSPARRPQRHALTAAEMTGLLHALGGDVSDPQYRGRPGRGRLGRLADADGGARRPRAIDRRRPVRHQPRPAAGAASRRASPTPCW